MGLDTSHNCWHGSYGSFMTWRNDLAKAAGLPRLDDMEGYYDAFSLLRPTQQKDGLPIKWNSLKWSPLFEILQHSDCDGEIAWEKCEAIANSLEELLPKLYGQVDEPWYPYQKTVQFIEGLRLAASRKENVDFH